MNLTYRQGRGDREGQHRVSGLLHHSSHFQNLESGHALLEEKRPICVYISTGLASPPQWPEQESNAVLDSTCHRPTSTSQASKGQQCILGCAIARIAGYWPQSRAQAMRVKCCTTSHTPSPLTSFSIEPHGCCLLLEKQRLEKSTEVSH